MTTQHSELIDLTVSCTTCEGVSGCRSVQIAQELGAEVVKCERGRAIQMNAGAKNATGNGHHSIAEPINIVSISNPSQGITNPCR